MIVAALRTFALGMASAWNKMPEPQRRVLRPLVWRVPWFEGLHRIERQRLSAVVPPASSTEAAPRWVGSTRPALLIAGHSHRYAFADYFNRSGQSAPVALLETTSSIDSETSSYWALALEKARTKELPLAIVWAGNQHNSHFLLESDDERFSIFPAAGPWEDGCPRPLVPRSLIREFFGPSVAPLRAVLARSTGLKVVVLGTPPPKSSDQVRAAIDSEPWLAEWAGRLGMTAAALRITPLSVRAELWKITQELLSAVCDEFGVTFVEVPESARSSGVLAAEESAPDSTHANGVWAETMIRRATEALAMR